MMWMLWLFTVAFLSLGGVYSHVCPKKCVCEHTKSVQCFRIQAVPSGISSDVTKLNLPYNHIKEVKVCYFCVCYLWIELGTCYCVYFLSAQIVKNVMYISCECIVLYLLLVTLIWNH